ncbi:MFS transporter [Antarcticimicrobium sediminis]|uniref:MFS transporter n=1 Tax=Antarcticimicrobium sediminis TaxID=2546227 RepID=A0A4R5ES47_9RHOB|nr:MFS transporter [Antarcticimicrobium sediminis]TDE37460.1 MFS transporter [Antarcticimicrobium sediminis]
MVGLIWLCLAYVLSQFFRAFLAVLSDVLQRDLGTTPEALATASGLWFVSFAIMQIPVGWALDRFGPRRTASVLLLLGGGGGAAVFALASSPAHISVAMFLIGIGCSPALMASYYIFAREYPPARFATLGALMLGVGSAGNLVASYPTALAAELIGWRGTLGGLAVLSAVVAVGLFASVRDPARVESTVRGSVLDILKMPVMWLLLPMMLVSYAPAATLRGLWIGPYLSDVFGLNTVQIGQATLVMGAAMIAGTLCYGPLDLLLRTRKWVMAGGALGSVAALLWLVAAIDSSPVLAVTLLAVIGFLGGYFPVIIAHGRAFIPAHLVGRGVTLLNLFVIGGVGLMQFITGRVHSTLSGGVATAPYSAIFGFLAISLLIGTLLYLFSQDSLD